jgi:hypothetical protein
MERKIKLLGLFMVLLLAMGFLGFFGSIIVVDAAPTIAVVEHEYYVVAGCNMTPTLPTPAPQPDDFTFTYTAFCGNDTDGVGPPYDYELHNLGTGGYNFGWLNVHGDREYLTAGTSISEPTGSNWNAYVELDITNNLGYAITIEDLTIELTSGTAKGEGLVDGGNFTHPDDTWKFPISGENLANNSMIVIDTFDPWDHNLIDEVNYNTGEVFNRREDGYPDHFRAATGTIRPATMGRGPGSLLEPDKDGDAASTGHVAPKYGGSAISVGNGETFTEYFGVLVLGLVADGMQIDGTVTVRLYYSPPPGGNTALVDLKMSNLQPTFPAMLDDTTYFYPQWANLNFNVTLVNIGNVPIDVIVNLYYSEDETTWIQIGSSQNVYSLLVTNQSRLHFNWGVRAENLSTGWYYVKVNGTASSTTDPAPDDTDDFNIRMKCLMTGDSNGDNYCGVGDQRKVQLAMFSVYGHPVSGDLYVDWQNRANYGPQIFTDFDGDLDVDVGDMRKQQLTMFTFDYTLPTS